MVQGRYLDIVQASSRYTVDVLTGIKLEVVMQDQVEMEIRVGSEVSVMDSEVGVRVDSEASGIENNL